MPSRFVDGIQFMRTANAALKRERPLVERSQIGPYHATVRIVPLTGSRGHTYDVCASWIHPRTGATSTTRIVREHDAAWRYLHELEDALRDPGPEDQRLRAAIGDA